MIIHEMASIWITSDIVERAYKEDIYPETVDDGVLKNTCSIILYYIYSWLFCKFQTIAFHPMFHLATTLTSQLDLFMTTDIHKGSL